MRAAISLILFLIFALSPLMAGADVTAESRDVKRGFFSVGGYYGMAGSRLLNTDGSMSDYSDSIYGLNLDILLWNAGTGDIRLFANNEEASGHNTTVGSNKLSSTETVAGLKIFAGSYLYLSGGWGRGQTSLTSDSTPNLKLSYEMVRFALGVEFPVTDSLFIGLEAAYKDAAIRKDRNDTITQNTFTEGFGGSVQLIWSPPSVTVINYQGKSK